MSKSAMVRIGAVIPILFGLLMAWLAIDLVRLRNVFVFIPGTLAVAGLYDGLYMIVMGQVDFRTSRVLGSVAAALFVVAMAFVVNEWLGLLALVAFAAIGLYKLLAPIFLTDDAAGDEEDEPPAPRHKKRKAVRP